jgi:hypothetical protein
MRKRFNVLQTGPVFLEHLNATKGVGRIERLNRAFLLRRKGSVYDPDWFHNYFVFHRLVLC